MTLDHVIPLAEGGGSGWNNTVGSCFQCNNAKGKKMPLKYHLERLAKLPSWEEMQDALYGRSYGSIQFTSASE